MHFLLETIANIQETMGKRYLLMVSLASNEFLPGENTFNKVSIIAQALEGAGSHAISVVGGPPGQVGKKNTK
jgi:2,4-dienoyl-CoA reductase (NADPH2)